MSDESEELVDSFGRVIPRKTAPEPPKTALKSENEGFPSDRRVDNEFQGRGDVRNDDRRNGRRSYEGGPRNFDGYNDYGRTSSRNYWNDEDRGYDRKYRADSRSRMGKMSMHGANSNLMAKPLDPLVSPVHQHITPLMSFKSFMLTQADDLSPEEYQRRYSEYNIQYVYDFSDTFFQVSKNESWFQVRYNPLKILECEQAVVTWTKQESDNFKQELLHNPSLVIQYMCLDKAHSINQAAMQARNRMKLMNTTDGTSSSTSSHDESSSNIAGKHLSGHEHRALFLTNIHASCTQSHLESSLNTILSNAECEVPQRVLLAQPMWTKTIPSRFERKAWIIMPTSQSLHTVMEVFKDGIDIPILGEVDPVTGEQKTLFVFHAAISHHFIKQPPHILPDYLSHPNRIHTDTLRAKELARLLDICRQVPEDCTLQAILDTSEIQAVCVKSTDVLDISIAYLRRVHFVVFYGGRSYQDEAHLLTMAPGCSLRATYYPPYKHDATNSHLLSDSAASADPSHSIDGGDVSRSREHGHRDMNDEEDNDDERRRRGQDDDEDDDGGHPDRVHDDDDTGDNIIFSREQYNQNIDPDFLEASEDTTPTAAVTTTTTTAAVPKTTDTHEPESPLKAATLLEKVNENQQQQQQQQNDTSTSISVEEVQHFTVSSTENPEDVSTTEKNLSENTSDTTMIVSEGEKDNTDVNKQDNISSGNDVTVSGDSNVTGEGQMIIVSNGSGNSSNNNESTMLSTGQSLMQMVASATSPGFRNKGRLDRFNSYVEIIIQDLTKKLKSSEKQSEESLSHLLQYKDENDARAIMTMNDKDILHTIECNAKPEKDNKVRCWYPFCNKLFKNIEFLRKHVTLKHDFFIHGISSVNAEPYMRERYESETIAQRPLPHIECEVVGGIERKSAIDILEKHKPTSHTTTQRYAGSTTAYGVGGNVSTSQAFHGGGGGGGHYNRNRRHSFHGYDNTGGGGGGGGDRHYNQSSSRYQRGGGRDDDYDGSDNRNLSGNIRNRDERDGNRRYSYNQDNQGYNRRRGSTGGPPGTSGGSELDSSGTTGENAPSPRPQAQYDPPKSEENFNRKLSTYLDVDAPKETIKQIDYGVAILPPAKKRKLVKKQ